MVKIASWNVNSIKPRLDNALSWLRAAQPDVLCLQEIKCVDEAFPKDAFADIGYNVAVHGQKTYNGVAILSKWPIDEAIRGLPGGEGRGKGDSDDNEARYLEAVISLSGAAIRVASIYAPNGNPVETEKYPYKLAWMARLKAHAADLLRLEEPLALAGDYNVIPEPEDVHNPAAWTEDALYKMETRRAYRELLNLGLTDALRACDGSPHRYTFWDYQAGAWQKDLGLRIDHILLSPQAAARLQACEIDKTPRGWEKPSDHTPIWAELAL